MTILVVTLLNLAGILTDSQMRTSQLRDSDGFPPFFPRYLQQLIPTETKIQLNN